MSDDNALYEPREPPSISDVSEITKATTWSKLPLSTICYNTDEYLEKVLKYLLDEQIILYYMWIQHKGEQGSKDHKHLLVYPSKSVELSKLRETFEEPDPNNIIPLGVMPWHTQSDKYIVDWILYILHDIDYLNQHGLKRIYHYNISDIHTNDTEFLNRYIAEIKQRVTEIEVLLGYIEQGKKWFQVAKCLRISTNNLKHFKETYLMLENDFEGFETFALDMVNQECDFDSLSKCEIDHYWGHSNEILDLTDKLNRAYEIIDILLNTKDNKQINFNFKSDRE